MSRDQERGQGIRGSRSGSGRTDLLVDSVGLLGVLLLDGVHGGGAAPAALLGRPQARLLHRAGALDALLRGLEWFGTCAFELPLAGRISRMLKNARSG